MTELYMDEWDEERPQCVYEDAKFYTAMRHRLLKAHLPASVLAVFVGLHTICDADSGVFIRDDRAMRDLLGLSKSTVCYAFRRLLKTRFIQETSEGEYCITAYADDRMHEQASYFRLAPPIFSILGNLVAHHHPALIHFALELMDCRRHANSEIRRSMQTLIHRKKLGSCASRVYKALKLLDGLVRYAITPSANGRDDVLQFWLQTPLQDVEQIKFRAWHGQVSRETAKAYRFAKGPYVLSWRELSRTTRLLVQYGLEQHLDGAQMARLGSYFGTLCAKHKILRRTAYLRKIRDNGDLIKCLTWLQKSA